MEDLMIFPLNQVGALPSLNEKDARSKLVIRYDSTRLVLLLKILERRLLSLNFFAVVISTPTSHSLARIPRIMCHHQCLPFQAICGTMR